MAVTCTGADRALVLSISGEVDHHGAGEILAALDRSVDEHLPRSLVLDLEGVTFMDSSGIAVLLRAYRRMVALCGNLTVRNVPPQAAKVLKAAGLARMIKFE
ncbi:MAG: STAS domain-containing protein [Pseudoflavonifractor sp.]